MTAQALQPQALEKLRTLGGEGLVSRVVALFLELGPQRLGDGRRALASGDLPTAERCFHSLRSSAANVGAVVPEVTAYRVVSDSQLEVDYRLTRPADRAVTCTITGLDARKGIVGTVTDEVPAGESRVQRSVEIRTAQRAVTGVVDSCVRH